MHFCFLELPSQQPELTLCPNSIREPVHALHFLFFETLHQYLSVEKPQSSGPQWCLGSKAHAMSVTLKPQTTPRPLRSKPLQLRALWPDPGPGSAIDWLCHLFLSLNLLVHKQGR